ncbi:hypothetical protein ACWEQJ_06260 [Streptomyces cyaneofuscatus]
MTTIGVEARTARMRRELVMLERAMRSWHDAPVGRDLVVPAHAGVFSP